MAYTTIDDPSAYFQTLLHAEDDTAFTFDGNSDLQPDMIWNKNRDENNYHHHIVDSVRGVSKLLRVSATIAEFTSADSITAIGSDGFTTGADNNGYVSSGTDKQVSWCWKESATAGMDIVSYTGNATARTISHSLSAVPGLMIIKCRSEAGHSWKVYHKSIGATKTLALQGTGTPDDDANYHNDTEPTSSVFTVGSNGDVNDDGETFIAYLFAEKQGYSKFGSYIANANANGIFEYTGFKPAFLLIKNTSQATDWIMYDNKREGYEPQNKEFRANTNAAERNAEDNNVQFCANGFKVRNAGTKSNADSGDNLIYIAFAEQPLVTSTGIPATAR
jgi:hypothetical protein